MCVWALSCYVYRFLTEWIILPNSRFRKFWDIVLMITIQIMANWYLFEAAYKGYYPQYNVGKSVVGHFKIFLYCCLELMFVVDIFISMKEADYVHMHGGKLLGYVCINIAFVLPALTYTVILSLPIFIMYSYSLWIQYLGMSTYTLSIFPLIYLLNPYNAKFLKLELEIVKKNLWNKMRLNCYGSCKPTNRNLTHFLV